MRTNLIDAFLMDICAPDELPAGCGDLRVSYKKSMSLRGQTFRTLALTGSAVIGAYLSVMMAGGMLMFGYRSPLEFALICAPVMAFPIAFLGCWKPGAAALLWALLMTFFFGTQQLGDWSNVIRVGADGIHFIFYLTAELLLAGVAVSDHRATLNIQPASGAGFDTQGQMSLSRPQVLRILALTGSAIIGAWLSKAMEGGLLVFGFKSPMEFAWICAPVMAFPIALLGWWKPVVGAVLWALMVVLFFGAQILIDRSNVISLGAPGTHFILFLMAGLLLAGVTVADHRAKSKI